jgi:hypothetical protein
MQTSKNTEELKNKVAAAAARRKQKLTEFNDASAMLRLENEAKLADIETETGKTLGIDLAVVWLKSGNMVVVGKPRQVIYEKYQHRAINNQIDAKTIDEFLAHPTVIYPDALHIETLWELEPEAKFAAALLAQRLCEVDQKSLEGKS